MDSYFQYKLAQLALAYSKKKYNQIEEYSRIDHSKYAGLSGYREFQAKLYTYKALAHEDASREPEAIKDYNMALFHYSQAINDYTDPKKVRALRVNASAIAYNLSIIYRNLRLEIIDNQNIESFSTQINSYLKNERVNLDLALQFLTKDNPQLNDQEKHRIAVINFNLGRSYESDNSAKNITEPLLRARKFYTNSLEFINMISADYVPTGATLSIEETKHDINTAIAGINKIIPNNSQNEENSSSKNNNCSEAEGVANLSKFASEFGNNNSNLWDHQKECIQRISRAFEQNARTGYVKMAKGSGKTQIFTSIAAEMNLETVIIVPTNIPLGQIYSSLKEKAPHLDIGIVDAKRKRKGDNITITTYASFDKIHKMKAFSDTKLIILDEAHASLSAKRATAIRYFMEETEKSIQNQSSSSNEAETKHKEIARNKHKPLIIGFTSTEKFSGKRSRGDFKSLDELFPNKFFDYPILKGIEDGILHSCKIVEVNLDEKISRKIKTKSNKRKSSLDFTTDQLEIIDHPEINRVITDIIANVRDPENGASFSNKKGIIFAVNINHAEAIKTELNNILGENFARTIHLNLDKKEINTILEMHKRKEISVLVNVDMLNVGCDDQQLEYIIDFRPTASSTRLLQTFGSLTRKDPASQDAKTYFQLIIPNMNLKVSELMDNRTRLGEIISSPEVNSNQRTEIQVPPHCYYQCVFSNGENIDRALASKKKHLNSFFDPQTRIVKTKLLENEDQLSPTINNDTQLRSQNNFVEIADYDLLDEFENLNESEMIIPKSYIETPYQHAPKAKIYKKFEGESSNTAQQNNQEYNHSSNYLSIINRNNAEFDLKLDDNFFDEVDRKHRKLGFYGDNLEDSQPCSSSNLANSKARTGTEYNNFFSISATKDILENNSSTHPDDIADLNIYSSSSIAPGIIARNQNSFWQNKVRSISTTEMDRLSRNEDFNLKENFFDLIEEQHSELGLYNNPTKTLSSRKRSESPDSSQASDKIDDQRRKKAKLSSSSTLPSSLYQNEDNISDLTEESWVKKINKRSNSRCL